MSEVGNDDKNAGGYNFSIFFCNYNMMIPIIYNIVPKFYELFTFLGHFVMVKLRVEFKQGRKILMVNFSNQKIMSPMPRVCKYIGIAASRVLTL